MPSTATCAVCGRLLPDRTGQRGRPGRFCPPAPGDDTSACARLDKRFAEIRTLSQRILDDLGDARDEKTRRHYMDVRSYLWREINAATNRKKLVSTGRGRYTKKRSGWRRNADAAAPTATPAHAGDNLPPPPEVPMFSATFTFTGIKDARAAYVILLDHLVDASAKSAPGQLVVTGKVADVEIIAVAQQALAAKGFTAQVEVREAVVEAEVVEEAVTAAVDVAADTEAAVVEAAPVAEAEVEAAPEPEPVYEAAFCVRFSAADKRALVEAGSALCRKLAGQVAFADPPTSWDDGAWCVSGRTNLSASALRVLAEKLTPVRAVVSVSRRKL